MAHLRVLGILILCGYCAILMGMEQVSADALCRQHQLIQWVMARGATKTDCLVLFQELSSVPFKYSATLDRKALKIEYCKQDFTGFEVCDKQDTLKSEHVLIDLVGSDSQKEFNFLPLHWRNANQLDNRVISKRVSKDMSVEVFHYPANIVKVVDLRTGGICACKQFEPNLALFLVMIKDDNATVVFHDACGNIFAWNYCQDLCYQLYREKKKWDNVHIVPLFDKLCLVSEKKVKSNSQQLIARWKCEVKDIFCDDSVISLLKTLSPKELCLLRFICDSDRSGKKFDLQDDRSDDSFYRIYKKLPCEIRQLIYNKVEIPYPVFEGFLDTHPNKSSFRCRCTPL